MRFISFAILVSGILLIRKLMWKHISKKTQYALWIFPALFLLLNPFWNISSKWSIENILFIFEQRTLQETEKYFPGIWDGQDGFRGNFNNHIYNEQNNGDAVMLNEIDEEEGQGEYWNSAAPHSLRVSARHWVCPWATAKLPASPTAKPLSPSWRRSAAPTYSWSSPPASPSTTT